MGYGRVVDRHPSVVPMRLMKRIRDFFLVFIALAFLASPGQAMTFEYRFWANDAVENDERRQRLIATGPIENGDTKRFLEFIAKDPVMFMQRSGEMVLDSPGGNVREALEMAQLLRDLLVTVNVFSPAKCASSCFLLYVAAPRRYALGAPTSPSLAIHRPSFAQDATSRMSPEEASEAHSMLYEKTRTWLQSQFVQQEIIDRLLSLPSSEAYWLTDADLEKIGIKAPWYEEWLIAQCPDAISAHKNFMSSFGTYKEQEARERLQRSARCEGNVVAPHRSQALRKLGIETP